MPIIRSRRLAALASAALVAVLLPWAPASASNTAQPAVVAETAATFTPNLLADSVIGRPKALAIVQHGRTAYVGGVFHALESSTSSARYRRANLAAFDARTGAVTSFAPNPNGAVWAIRPVGKWIYIGGEFTRVGGVERRGLARINAVTGKVDRGFKPAIPSGRVSEIRFVNGRLLIGGTFPGALRAVNRVTGKNTGYLSARISGMLPRSSGKVEVRKFATNPAGTRLVAVGNFTHVLGQPRSRALMLNLGRQRATLNPWYYKPLAHQCKSRKPDKIASLQDVDFAPNGRYFVLVATGFVPASPARIGIDVCDAAARFETGVQQPRRPTWINYTGGDTLHSVAVSGAAVYVQGHNRWLNNPQGRDSKGPGAVDRLGIGAINPATGRALPWNPPKPAAQGGFDFYVTAQGLWVASDSQTFGGAYHRGIAFAPLP